MTLFYFSGYTLALFSVNKIKNDANKTKKTFLKFQNGAFLEGRVRIKKIK